MRAALFVASLAGLGLPCLMTTPAAAQETQDQFMERCTLAHAVEETANMVHIGSKLQNFGGQGIASARPPITFAVPEIDREWTNYHAPTSLRERWVEFALEWGPDSVCFYVDALKILCQSYQWIDNARKPAQPASIIMSMSVGGAWAGRYGVDDAAFPTFFEIDHVRVYRRGS